MTNIQPTGVKADRGRGEVRISWSDGVECTYTFAGLRAVCPCVECRGGHAQMGQPPDMELLRTAVNKSLSLEQIVPVGSYALQFYWSDGHATGIYTWDYLRQACSAQSDNED